MATWKDNPEYMRQRRRALLGTPKKKKTKHKKKNKQPKKVVPKIIIRHRYDYLVYLESSWWRSKRRQKGKSVNWKCESCLIKRATQIHHLHYNSLGCERNSDLEAVCGDCHKLKHYALNQMEDHLDSIR